MLDELILNGELQETSRKMIVHTQKKIEQAESEENVVRSFFLFSFFFPLIVSLSF